MKCILHMSTTTLVYLMMLNCLLFVCVCEINLRASFIKDTCRLPLTSSKRRKSHFVFFFCYFFFGGGGLVFYFHKTIVRNKALSCI